MINWSVYPNPAISEVSISTSLIGNYSLRILDLNGKVVYKSEFEGNEINLNLNSENIQKGMYLIQIESESTLFTERLLINE